MEAASEEAWTRKSPHVTQRVKTTVAQADALELDRELDEAEQEELVAQIEAVPGRGEYAEADRLGVHLVVPNDVYTNLPVEPWPEQGGVSFTQAWDMSRGNGQTIAVLDTGITSPR
ncbi:hypothetical protein QJS66_03250 [Kocuria rhizophila]|nr:hypothetical protein QJS66_03250 [Kocuria rhizophila]